MISFKTQNAQKIFESYIKRVNKCIDSLREKDREDIRMEIENHIYESVSSQNNPDEVTSILSAIQQLGEPEDFLKPIVAEKKLYRATRSFNPIHVFSALVANIGNGLMSIFKFGLFMALYFAIFSFFLVGVMRIIMPRNTGLFIGDDGFWTFGVITPEPRGVDQFGAWTIPICFGACIVLYFLLTLLLRLFSKRT